MSGRGRAVHSALAVACLVFAAGASAAPARTAELSLGPALAVSASASLASDVIARLVGDDGKAHVVVVFRDEPAALVWSEQLDAGATQAQARLAASRAAQEMTATQQAYLANLAQRGIDFDPVYALQRTLNAVVIRVEPDDLDALRTDPSVERVEFVPLHEPTHQTSVPFIGAPQAWGNTIGLPAGVTGQGMRIGIIDTGIDYQHPAFGGSGVLADYQANDRTIITDQIGGNPIFPTAKVVGGWDFAGDAYNGGASPPVPDPDPMDCQGHGTHVAGTAGAFGVTMAGAAYAGPWDAVTDYSALRIGPGVAPQAQLYALRVFGCGGSTALTTLAIERAADPNQDLDFSDRLDVINMSLGSNYGLPFDLSSVASDNAATTGMVVVASAGNAGETVFISGSPGAGSRVIAVANTLDAGIAAVILDVNAPAGIAGRYPAAATTYTDTVPPVPQPSGQTGPLTLVNDGTAAAGGGTLTDACEAMPPGSLTGQVALVDRGLCNFTVKVLNVQAAGAIAMVSANNVVGDPVPAGLGGAAAGDVTIPALAVSQATGATLRSVPGVVVTLRSTSGGDTVNFGSSRGPRGGGGASFLKPELAAPGTSITSAQTGNTCTAAAQGCITPNGTGFIPSGQTLTISGTSMAAPHVAGMMALLRQLNPSRSVEELKAMAMSSSRNDLNLGAEDSGPRFGASRIGAGRVDVPQALAADVFAGVDATDGSVAAVFEAEPSVPGSTTRTIRISNRKAVPQNVTLSVDTVIDAPGISFSIVGPAARTVPIGGSITVDVRMDADPAAMDRSRDPTLTAVNNVTAPATLAGLGNLPRHFLTEESALLVVRKGANEVSRVPLYAAIRPHSTLAAPTALFQLPATGTQNLPMTGTGLCTGTLAAGSCTTPTPADRASLVSPFELQLQPALDGSIPPYASVRYVGVSFNAAAEQFYFGVASHDEWSTTGNIAYNICIDGNEDGTYERVLFNSDLGNLARLFGQNVSGTDVFMNAVFTPPGSVSFGGATGFVNLGSAAGIEIPVHDNDTMVLAATTAQLGLVGADRSFRYAVSTCPGFNPLCVRLTAPTMCSGSTFQQVPTVATYNGAAPGVTSSGGLLGPILIPEQSGTSVPIGYNLANLAANGSAGVLLLHHHNTDGTRAQVATFSIAPGAISATGDADPAAAGITEQTLLTVDVVPGTSPASTGLTVRADLTAIGGSATQAFLDDGVAPDATAGDNVYSYLATVGAGSTIGATSFAATVQDVEGRSANAQIAFEVLAATDPTATGLATPASAGETESTVLTVEVTPGAAPPSTGITVEADLTSIGGSATQAFLDDGVAPDATAGDNIFTFEATVAAGSAVGATSFPVSVEDAESRTGSASIAFEVLAATDPSVSGVATPASVYANDSTVLTATVTPGANPDSTGIEVTVDLSAIGGSATQAMLDDGVAPDATAGDNVFTVSTQVIGLPGNYDLPVEVTDDEGRDGQSTIDLDILPPLGELIFENGFEGP